MPDCTTTMVGRLGGSPELRFTTGGAAVANFSLAVDHRFQRNNEWESETSWFRVTCWRDLAEHVAASIDKGDRVIVTGRLQERTWTTPEGDKRSVIEVTADEIGPSLRWNDVQIERTEREKPTNENRQAGGSTGGNRSEPLYTEEEPF